MGMAGAQDLGFEKSSEMKLRRSELRKAMMSSLGTAFEAPPHTNRGATPVLN